VFHTPFPSLLHEFDARDVNMSNTFNMYWANLARYGDPNGALDPGAIAWSVDLFLFTS
jgi:hypothetical protein